ncbi:MAG: aminotransferase class I/II-fold pyridoxal phosphate-dependent enzyme [Lachnospiraceae bacterium]|nr:aminotransferase class I/II-fold pyridoxal phosphate-dependent enzyme [Lachnospiraceae bacterium]
MKSFEEMTKEELLKEKESLEQAYRDYQKRGLSLNMARGKPANNQLDLANPMMDALTSESDFSCADGDVRNYGVLAGITEAREFFAEILQCDKDEVILGGSASLTLMYDTISRSYTHGVLGETPWCKQDKLKFLCPVPGYDRHFAITEHFGIEMINIPLTEDGPDMDMVEKYVNNDPAVKGIWCVPKYANPTGVTYSDETVKRFAALKPAAKDFRIFWDNAYCEHHLYPEQDQLLSIMDECKKNHTEDMVYIFASTSKMSMAGSGISAMALSKRNREDVLKQMGIQMISYDKVNQLRHIRFFKNVEGLRNHMKEHAKILKPKFDLLEKVFDEELKGCGAGQWTTPHGGYFITYTTMDGCAKRVIELCKEAGMVMTGAGAPFPYKKDEHDSTIRIAPSLPPIEELEIASHLFVVCVKLATVEKLIG